MSQQRRAGSSPRRENAPIRRGTRPAGFPDLLFALAATAWGMGFVVAIALFGNSGVVGEVGTALARVFASALGAAGLFLFLLGVSLLGDDRNRADHYVVPMSVGLAVGALEALLVITGATGFVLLPLPLLILSLRPVRGLLSRMTGNGGRR